MIHISDSEDDKYMKILVINAAFKEKQKDMIKTTADKVGAEVHF